jgi:hypothetical protein
VWLYCFGYIGVPLRPKQTGAKHASELPYLFRTPEAGYGQEVTAQDREAATGVPHVLRQFCEIQQSEGAESATLAAMRFQFGPLALTRAMCPLGPLHDRMMWLYSSGHTETRTVRSIRGVFDEPIHDENLFR